MPNKMCDYCAQWFPLSKIVKAKWGQNPRANYYCGPCFNEIKPEMIRLPWIRGSYTILDTSGGKQHEVQSSGNSRKNEGVAPL